MTAVLLAIPLAPLAGVVIIAALPARARRSAGWVASGAAGVSLLCAVAAWGSGAEAALPWFRVGRLEAELSLSMDPLSALMTVLVAAMCLVVDVYGIAYMEREPRRHVFFAWMSFFAAAMLALVLAGSLFLLFAAWEGVSLASYGLIAFHHRERAARRAAARAFAVTRLGDLGLLLSVALLFLLAGESGFPAALELAESGSLAAPAAAAAGLGILVAAVAKSAQLPLSAWLPDAMVAPTPVSALLHSATMVAAGVYLLVRFEPLLTAAPGVAEAALWVGAITAVAAALAAATAGDLKRVLAWSTVSHLGEMMVAVAHASPEAAVLHLTIHAFFKACLFLVAGAVDQRAGARRLDRLGGLAPKMPLPALAFATAAASLAALPPLAGFFSGEALLGAAAAAGPSWILFEVALIYLAGAYIGRAGAAVFLPWPNAPRPAARSGRVLADAAIVALAAAAAAGGALAEPIRSLLLAPGAPSPPVLASALAVAAGIAGLGFGLYRVRAAGPAPAFGDAPAWIERAAGAAISLPTRAALGAARALPPVESALDRAARRTASGARRAAQAAGFSESALDRAGRGAASGATASARAAVTGERGLGWGGDQLGGSLSLSGGLLRLLQNGKLYFYTASVFVAVLAVGGLLVVLALA